ncbi:methylmalonyl Co-A mutase-associated GTPase MeaB [Mangrovibrevibacter kandeliae]|uniref:methylmalonyl Co-A mutase-associated GTPase MeaB n=1 Tax=Mangrovibrevibacter kandeliae TaxID=2968473 RepID=UPI002118CA3B|nr:methylmalonyl Co-A mutase-associated GTPase MeaB [Aurantimonas sp. CSK15Z-1]MCQ8780851.1 methylmalonyl Co-A mutase-associated GTPase MeaB [Aurantimonas sp. CSK15Z-1]
MPELDLADLAGRIFAGERAALARGITLVESTRQDHRRAAAALLERLVASSEAALRIGVSGVPGVGKSTFIERFGSMLTGAGRRVAVLAVDPSSARSGGSILGDKTRMAHLAADPNAFVRPSPTSGTLGGVAGRTRETIRLCEAAGYDVVIVETVGVGQSETAVAEMTDLFLLLMLAGGGDQLQGLKKGVLELADIVAVNKADGENVARAGTAAAELAGAFRILGGESARVPVRCVSGLTGTGLPELWREIEEQRDARTEGGAFEARRRAQDVRWLHALLEEGLRRRFLADPTLRAALSQAEQDIAAGSRSAPAAAEALLRSDDDSSPSS